MWMFSVGDREIRGSVVRIRWAWEEVLHPASTGSLLKTGLGETARFEMAVLD